ncbi:MAG: fatty acid desaturase [Steroidobacteraceae bacterium]|jgi:fatty acid desaturase
MILDRTAPATMPASTRRKTVAVELPSLFLIVFTYSAWFAVTLLYGHWPLWAVASLTAVIVTLHSSLQHEFIHGHPTRWSRVNRLLGIVPLSLWLPYDRYRVTHLAHHVNERLTDPHDDPETYYWSAAEWAGLTVPGRTAVQIQQTLLGRMLLGSFWRILHFLRAELHAIQRNDARVRAAWAEHLFWCVPVLLWVKLVCGMPIWIYVTAVVIPSNGILLIRSFAEHRARESVPERTAIVEDSWILGPLFLFNNLHALHHDEPHIPWYDYQRRYRLRRSELVAANGGLVYSSYFAVARRYLLRPHDRPVHPRGQSTSIDSAAIAAAQQPRV